MSNNLDGLIGLCRLCGESLGGTSPPLCIKCADQEKSRTSHRRESDPYKRVWNSVEDEEGELLNWVKNGTLFVPTSEEMTHRNISKAKYLLAKARRHGRTAEGISVFNEAMSYRSIAKECVDRHVNVLLKSR